MKKNNLLLSICFGLAGIVLSGFAYGVARAEEGIQISPLTYQYDLAPGKTETATMFLRNLSSKPLSYVLESENFEQVSDEGVPSFNISDLNNADTLAGWVDFGDSKEGILEPGEQRRIDYEVVIPMNATPGGHYAGIFARTIPNQDSGSQIAIASRVGATMLVAVDGETRKSAVFEELNYPKIIKSIGKNTFSLKVRNTGNVYFSSGVKAEITNMFGKVETLDFGTHIIAHQNARSYSATWHNQYPFGKYNMKLTAEDDSGNIISQTVSFWAFPLQIVIPGIIILAFMIVAIVLLRRNRKNSEPTF